VPPKVEHGGAGPLLQVFQPDDHVQVGSVATAVGYVAVGQDLRAEVGECFGLALRGGALVVGGEWGGVGVEGGGDGVEQGGVVEPAGDPPSRPAAVAAHVEFVDLGGGAVVGFGTVGVERIDHRGPDRQQLGGAGLDGLSGEDGLDLRPHRGCEPGGGVGAQHLADHLDVAQPDPAVLERRGGGGQPGWQHGAVEPDTLAHLLRAQDAAAGIGPLTAQQVRDRTDRVPVTAVGEHPAALQGGDGVDGDQVQPACGAFADGENGEHLGVPGGRAGGMVQRVEGLGEEALRGSQPTGGHALILLEQPCDFHAFLQIRAPSSRYDVRCTGCVSRRCAELLMGRVRWSV